VAFPRRYLDRLRHASRARAWDCVDTSYGTQYLHLWTGRASAAASRAESICVGRELAANQLHPRHCQLWLSPTVHRKVEHRRRVVQPFVLDQSRPGLLSLAGGSGRGSRLAHQLRSTVVGWRSIRHAAAPLVGRHGILRPALAHQARNFRWSQMAPLAGLQIPQVNIHDAHPLQALGFVTERRTHAADLAV
jgi:hypothetical protein